MSRVLILGASGNLGTEIVQKLEFKPEFDLAAPKSSNLDIRNANELFNYVAKFKPEWILNCAAWTNVDGAEKSFKEALSINSDSLKNIVSATKRLKKCSLVHFSTDYVFDGHSMEPYTELSQANPINNYGLTKYLGEKIVTSMNSNYYIVRTSWLYGLHKKNFVKTMVDKALKFQKSSVVFDQVGSPTNARDLATGIISLMQKQPEFGLYNFSNEGSCSWYEFAQEIYDAVGCDPTLVVPISSSEINSPARRPLYTVLSKTKWKESLISEIPHWKESLLDCIPEFVTNRVNSSSDPS